MTGPAPLRPSSTPWTPEQVDELNRYQRDNASHSYTCPNRNDGSHRDRNGDLGGLLATTDGWVCEDCDYRQEWAHQIPRPPRRVTPPSYITEPGQVFRG